MRKIRKAVIPAAGFGTRFLPATKVIPKELLPIVDRPVIQLVIEEAVQSGIEEVILVTHPGKRQVAEHFESSPPLEEFLDSKGKYDILEELKQLNSLVRVRSVEQKVPLGLGHAVLCAKEAVGEEPFAVLLPDDIVSGSEPCLRQLLGSYEETPHDAAMVALYHVPLDQIHRYGVIEGNVISENLYQVERIVEKPSPEKAPSLFAVMGRYILPSQIFSILEEVPPGVGGEIQLTDGLARLAQQKRLYGYCFEGTWYDVGSKLGFLQANVALGLGRSDVGPELRRFLNSCLLKS
jgi:UTP--glucose-1-phosphate uridylyltransferase